jgi:hypothetical protein
LVFLATRIDFIAEDAFFPQGLEVMRQTLIHGRLQRIQTATVDANEQHSLATKIIGRTWAVAEGGAGN